MSRDRVQCAVPLCFVPRVHDSDCEDYQKCGGCAPGLAASPLLTCTHHHERAVDDLGRLPALYARLAAELAPYRSPQAPKGDGGPSSEAPDAVNARVFDTRQRILNDLGNLAAYVIVESHSTASVRGDVFSLTDYLTRNAEWLSTNPVTAARWGAKVRELVQAARRIIASSRQTGIYLGACPQPVAEAGEVVQCGAPIRYQRPDKVAEDDDLWLITCPSCGTEDTVEWWRQRIAGDVAEVDQLPAGPLAMRLSVLLSAEVTETRIRRWKFDGKLQQWVSWCDLTTKRVTTLYDRAEAEQHARKVYGIEATS